MAEYLNVDAKSLLQLPVSAYATFRAINQPPDLSSSDTNRSYLKSLTTIPNAYYGIGGDKETYRTFIPVIGLKKYKEKVKEFCGIYPLAVLYDAYPYDLLNQVRGYRKLKDVWKAFLDLLEENKDGIEPKISKRRDIYQRMATLAGTKIRYVDANWLLKKPEYEDILFGLLNAPSLLAWESLVPVSRRDNPASLLYVPMEIAEALALKQEFGIGLKIGDKKEKGFDNLIYREDRNWLFAYTPPAITKNGERPPYRNDDDINFDMTPEEADVFIRDVFFEKAPIRTPEELQFCGILKELNTDAIGGNRDYRASWSCNITRNAFRYVKGETECIV